MVYYNPSIYSLYTWLVFHPLYTLKQPGSLFIAQVMFDRNVSLCLKPTVSPEATACQLESITFGAHGLRPTSFAISDQTAPKKRWIWGDF